MILLFDQDGTIADFDPEFERRWSRFGVCDPVPARLRTHHDYRTDYPEEHWGLIDELMAQEGFFLSLKPIPGAVEAVLALADEGHDIRICTTPIRDYRYCLAEKAQWIDQHLGPAFVDKMILTRDKTVVRGDLLIDDKPDIKGACRPEWRQVLVDQAYNKHRTDLPRVRDWRDEAGWRQALFVPTPGHTVTTTAMSDAPAL